MTDIVIVVVESTFRIWSIKKGQLHDWWIFLDTISFLFSTSLLRFFYHFFVNSPHCLYVLSYRINHNLDMSYITDCIIIMCLLNVFRQPSSLRKHGVHNEWRITYLGKAFPQMFSFSLIRGNAKFSVLSFVKYANTEIQFKVSIAESDVAPLL